MVMIF